ncbi:MAG: glycosyltransferase family 4 protein [Candidatus Cloacimonetes bacterium]|nr:glycosyltransferase family 4 protein [Candidatus Cloacimonadota bacterium]
MIIAINALGPSRFKAGIGNYVVNIITKLAKLDKKNKYIIYTSKKNADFFQSDNINFNVKDIGFFSKNRMLRIFWEQFLLPISLIKNNVDLLHSPGFVCPIIKTCKSVITIHDMTFFSHPKVHTWFKRIYFPIMIYLSSKVCNKIISVSNYTTNETKKYLKISGQKIITIHESFNESLLQVKDYKENSYNKYSIDSDYLLFVGTLEPRKNIKSIILSLDKIKNQNIKLVIVGKKGWMYKEMFSLIQNLKLENRIIFTGYVPDNELGLLFENAKIFIYPSLFEGFGIPILEAMYFNCPVITSNLSSMPEVAGKAAVLVDPYNISELVDAINNILSSKGYRQKLIQEGRKNIKKFSWEKTAKKTLKVYESLK